ncbi:putative DNA-directed RNA polymerase II subunit RPB1-like [Rosellinia necatrix]|uniref:Putative DNA-directed RNA polymerase II subunit RPB1-like n=1 Tax=Rosellinia necatrix TaxID=77044 RepID=A0A1W2TUT1_ROSNE|nr:putative DNA-directed RNA polymerase II subunit RPB1-like [Rosellinia necatrix]
MLGQNNSGTTEANKPNNNNNNQVAVVGTNQLTMNSNQFNQSGMNYNQSVMDYSQPAMDYNQSDMDYSQSDMNYSQPVMDYNQSAMDYSQSDMNYSQPVMDYNQSAMDYSQSDMNYSQPVMDYNQSAMDYDQSAMNNQSTMNNQLAMSNQSAMNNNQSPMSPSAMDDQLLMGFQASMRSLAAKRNAATTVGGAAATTGAVVPRGAQEFHLFQHLPTELRWLIWDHSMAESRLVHLHARPSQTGYVTYSGRRRGCPRGQGDTVRIDGRLYQQVPPQLLVCREARDRALERYNITFTVSEAFVSQPSNQVVRTETHLMMSPDDILVPWHIGQYFNEEDYYTIRFSPGARFVRNLMVYPWKVLPRYYVPNEENSRKTQYIRATASVLLKFLAKLGNKDAFEKLFLLGNVASRGPLTYRDAAKLNISFINDFYATYIRSIDPNDTTFSADDQVEMWLMLPKSD